MNIDYIDRYAKIKILQVQSANDELFFPDNEVFINLNEIESQFSFKDYFWKDLQNATGGTFLRSIFISILLNKISFQ